MQKFIHSNISNSNDQIISDDDCISSSKPKRKLIEIVQKKGKPFWLTQKNIEQNNVTALTASAYQNTTLSNQIQQKSSVSSNYKDDFQSFQEEIDESVHNKKQQCENKNKVCEEKVNIDKIIGMRENNYSAMLPKIKKQTHIFENNRYSVTKKDMSKSTLQLRQQNRKIIKSIETIRNLIPQYSKNKKIIDKQSIQIKKMKHMYSRIFDIDYQLNLDRSKQKKIEQICLVNSRIRITEQKLKKNFKYKGKNSRIRKNLSSNPEQNDKNNYYSILREDLLFYRRTQQNHNKKLIELTQKIMQYRLRLNQLEQRERAGQHQELTHKKMVLQYDVMMHKSSFQQQQCKLMMQIAELNNQGSRLQVELHKINQTLRQTKLNSNKTQSKHQSTQQLKLSSNHSETTAQTSRTTKKLINLFSKMI